MFSTGKRATLSEQFSKPNQGGGEGSSIKANAGFDLGLPEGDVANFQLERLQRDFIDEEVILLQA